MAENKKHLFTRFAKLTSHYTGKPITFITAVGIVIIWAVTGPFFDFSNTWQLVINTGTTIITFLMVFLIQNTQNRDTEALQIKLDEIIRSLKGARNEVLELEELDEQELDEIREEYLELAHVARKLKDEREAKKSGKSALEKK
jgi:low affinity Fe/Cu permease